MSASLESLASEHGEAARAAAEAWLDELVVLTFRENRRGGDPIAHTTDGRAVFPDKYRDGDRILADESWLCTVARKGDNTFFAAPLARLDEDFFRGLMPAERRRVAEALWEEHRDVLLDELRELIRDEDGSSLLDVDAIRQAAADEEASRLRQERDELRERLTELAEQYDDAAARLALSPAQAHPEPVEATAGGHAKEARGPFPIARPEPDILECEAFEEARWHAHVSPNGRVLFLKAHPRGPIVAESGRLAVPSLARFAAPEMTALEARFDPRHGGFFVSLA